MIYDGDRETQDSFRSTVLDNPSSRSKRGESLERERQSRPSQRTGVPSGGQSVRAPSLRRSHSEDLLIGPVAKRSNNRKRRGELNVRLVDFAHTTTGKDWLPYPEQPLDGQPEVSSSSKGYMAEVDPETGMIYARFPPHYPDQPDRGFLYGLKNLTSTLESIWNEERIKRIKASAERSMQLPTLSTEGKEIFDQIFGEDAGEDSGNISS